MQNKVEEDRIHRMNTEEERFNAVVEETESKPYVKGGLQTSITIRNGKYGVIRVSDGQIVIPCEYDNILRSFAYDPLQILYRNGKVGAVYLDETAQWIAPCQFDSFRYYGGDLLLRTAEESRYFFEWTKTTRDFLKVHHYGRYLYGIGHAGCAVMRTNTGETLWSMSNDSIAREMPHGVPSLAFMGEYCNLPLFFDVNNRGYLIPQSGLYVDYILDLPDIIKPVIVNGKNVINIVGGPDGIDAVEFDGRWFYESFPCEYDEATIELRLRLRKGTDTEERIIPIPQGRFDKNSFFDFCDWGAE